MADTIVRYKEMTPEENERWQKYYYEKMMHDEANALNNARREGEAKGKLATLVDLVKKGIITVLQAAEQENMTVEEFEKAASQLG